MHSVVPVVSRRRVAASTASRPPLPPVFRPRAACVSRPGRPATNPWTNRTATQLARPPAGMRELETSPHVHVNNHTATHNMLNSKSHTSLTHTHSKCIALSTQARPEPAETVCRSARHENASNSDTTHSTACLGHTHKPLTRPPRAGSWVSVRYLELNRPTLVRSSASLPSPAATRRASPSSACA